MRNGSFLKWLLLTTAIVISSQSLAGQSFLPLNLALEAAQTALQICQKGGFNVTVTVVNVDGLTQVVLKGDQTGPHTLDSSKYKAYTAASIAPIINMDATSEIAKRILSTPGSSQLANLPNILLVGGGMAIRSDGKIIGAIGVGGAPGGDLDEVCAKAGVEKIKDRVL